MKMITDTIKLNNTLELIKNLKEKLHDKTREQIYQELQIILYMATKYK